MTTTASAFAFFVTGTGTWERWRSVTKAVAKIGAFLTLVAQLTHMDELMHHHTSIESFDAVLYSYARYRYTRRVD